MSLYQSRDRRYVVDNEWLAANSGDRDAYVDIQEIKTNPSSSTYLQNLAARYGFTGTRLSKFYDDEQVKAAFFPTGLHVGDTDDGSHIRGCLRNEVTPYDLKYPAGEYDQGFRRIYAAGTTARNLAFMGYDL